MPVGRLLNRSNLLSVPTADSGPAQLPACVEMVNDGIGLSRPPLRGPLRPLCETPARIHANGMPTDPLDISGPMGLEWTLNSYFLSEYSE